MLGCVAAPARNIIPVLLLLVFTLFPVASAFTLSQLFFRLLGVPAAPQAPVAAFEEAVQVGDASSLVLLAIAAVVIAPLGEELLFRGFLFTMLRSRWRTRRSWYAA